MQNTDVTLPDVIERVTLPDVIEHDHFITSGEPYRDPKIIKVETRQVARILDKVEGSVQELDIPHVQVEFGYSADRGGLDGRLPDTFYLTSDEADRFARALQVAAAFARRRIA